MMCDPYDTGTPKYSTSVAIYDALGELVQTKEMSILSEIFTDVSYDNQDYIYTEKGYALQKKFDELCDYGNKMWIIDLAIMQIDKGEVHETVFEALNNSDLAKRLGFKKLFIEHALNGDYAGRYAKVIEDLECELRELDVFRYHDTARAFGKAMLDNGAPSSYNPYPDYNSFCNHLSEKINSMKLTEEVKLVAECRALLTSYDDFMYGLKMNQALHESQEMQYAQKAAQLQASYEEKLGQLYIIAERMGITPDSIGELQSKFLPCYPVTLTLESICELEANPLAPKPTRDKDS